jgi:hypothetical protein
MSDTPTTILDEVITDIDGTNGVASITVKATKGNFKVAVEGDTTANVKFNASAAELKAALEAIGSVDIGDITVSGGPGDATGTKPYLLAFAGQYAGANVPTVTTDTSGLEEGSKEAKVATVTVGTDENPDAVQRGTGLADRTEDTSPLVTGESPTERREAHKAEFGDA